MGEASRQNYNHTGHVMDARGAYMVLRTNRKAELTVKSQLPQDEYEVYRPMTEVRIKQPKGAPCDVLRAVPIYPGYLFVKRLSTMTRSITGLIGVKELLIYGVSEAFVQAHKDREVEGLIDLLNPSAKPKSAYQPGDKVQTIDGLLDLIFMDDDGEKRARCLSTMLGAERIIRVDLAKIIRTG